MGSNQLEPICSTVIKKTVAPLDIRMHFWIDKRSQGCGFNRRHQVPTSLSGYRRPKPMVTPVHRFQSIESVATNGLRHPRAPGYHTRYTHTPVHYSIPSNGSTRSSSHGADLASTGNSTTPRLQNAPASKLKCGVWAFFAIVTFFLAGAKYYFHGVNMGIEALAFCSLLVVILILGGLVSLFEAITTTIPPQANPSRTALQQETSEDLQVPNSSSPGTSSELPPPPYHIAVMLPQRQCTAQIVGDSPPPPYDKAIT